MANEMYEMLNLTYMDFIEKLVIAFGKDIEKQPIPALNIEYQVVLKLMDGNTSTDRIFKRIQEGFKDTVDRIYERDVKLFTRRPKKRVALFECAHLYEVFPRMQKDEHELLWESLQNLAQPLGTLGGSSKYIDQMTDIAQEFLSNNPNANEHNSRDLLFSQMLNNPSIMQKTAQIFEQHDLSTMRGDFAQVLKGFGLTASRDKDPPKTDEANKGAKIEEIKDEDDEEEEKTSQRKTADEDESTEKCAEKEEEEESFVANMHVSSSSSSSNSQEDSTKEFDSMQSMFADMAAKDASISKKTAKRRTEKKKSNPLKNMINYMETKPLSAEQVQEMKEIAKKTLSCSSSTDANDENKSGDGSGEDDRNKMRRLFGMFCKDSDPSDIVAELHKSCDATDEESQELLAVMSQFQQGMSNGGVASSLSEGGSLSSLFEKFTKK